MSKANEHLMNFCRGVEDLYGSILITPNMHMHKHLIDCITDFDPIYAFWLFAFGRFNGLLGLYPNNKKDREIQIFRRFLRSQELKSMQLPNKLNDDFDTCFDSVDRSGVGSLADTSEPAFACEKVVEAEKLSLIGLVQFVLQDHCYQQMTR